MNGTKAEEIEFGEVTFAIPAQTFGITCSVSAERTLPVVTEFALRMIHVCESVTAEQIQEFFGFNEREVEQVIHTLIEERLVRWEEDRLQLTHYARGLFLESLDSIPRLTKIKDWSGEVAFELVGFTPVNPTDGAKRARLMVEVPADDPDKESKSRLWAERSFQENFDRIYRGSRAEIYKISGVEASTRFLLPVPCTFSVTLDGELSVKRSLPEDFLADRLELSQAVTTILAHPPTPDNRLLKDFATLFGDEAILKHIHSGAFDLHRYLLQVSSKDMSAAPFRSVIGCLHLDKNHKMLDEWIQSCGIDPEHGAMGFWIAPRLPFWGRSRRLRTMITSLQKVLKPTEAEGEKGDPSASNVKVLLQHVEAGDRHYTKTYSVSLPEVYGTSACAFGGRLEIFLISGKVVCALFHYQLQHPVTVPIGFISKTTDHLSVAEKIIRDLTRPPAHVDTLTRGGAGAEGVFSEVK